MSKKFDQYLDAQAKIDMDNADSIKKFLNSLTIQAAESSNAFAAIAPAWLVSEKEDLDDFMPDFDDPEQRAVALRDFACVPVFTINPFFKNPAAVYTRAVKNRVCPIEDDLSISDKPGLQILPYPGARYFFAADLSVNTDSIGIALLCRNPYLPDAYEIVFTKQMRVTKDVEADYEYIELLIKMLRDRHFDIAGVGFDQYQSHRTKQILEKQRFNVQIVTYRESLACCRTLKELMLTGRLIYGQCDEVFMGEATELQVVNNKRIDHLSSGGVYNSKDVWDAVVDALFLCMETKEGFVMEYD